MSDLVLVLTVAAITFASRVAFLVRPRPAPGGLVGRFLDVFPLALFVAIATSELLTPAGSPEVTPAVAAAIGGIAGAAIFRRALLGVLAIGAVFFYVVRALLG